MTTCFGHLNIIRPSLQNVEYCTCIANNIHVIWNLIRLTTYVLKCIKTGQDERVFSL